MTGPVVGALIIMYPPEEISEGLIVHLGYQVDRLKPSVFDRESAEQVLSSTIDVWAGWGILAGSKYGGLQCTGYSLPGPIYTVFHACASFNVPNTALGILEILQAGMLVIIMALWLPRLLSQAPVILCLTKHEG